MQTLHFLRVSRDAQRSDYGGRFRYLFRGEGAGAGGKALEEALADDFALWLHAGPLGSRIRCEVRSIGGGRVDILIAHGDHRFVCEVKREEHNVGREGLAGYLQQTVQYQATDIALGMLLVLDLTDRQFGRMLEAGVWVEIVRQEHDLERAVIVALVEGDRAPPSELGRSRRTS